MTAPLRRARLWLALVVSALLALALVGPGAPAFAAPSPASGATQPSPAAPIKVAKPPTPSRLPAGIEALQPYVAANSCSPVARPGTIKLGKLLTRTYPGTTFGGSRGCGLLPDSEHHDGRAVDWMNSIRNPRQAAQANAVISWLLSTDSHGNKFANARRLGVMYIIWDNKIWGAYNQSWRPYAGCANRLQRSNDTACHRDHIHISLSWAGAQGRTSFWTGKVAAIDYGRCRPADLNWAYSYDKFNPRPCARYGKRYAPAKASPLLRTLTNYSGRPLSQGSRGPVVSAVQQGIGVKVTGSYDAGTVAAMKKWQKAHHVPVNGRMNYTTWRALLKALAPR